MALLYQTEFLQTAREIGALSFGQFTLKSGRVSPYFFNAGAFCYGASLFAIANAYAHKINSMIENGAKIDGLYGPAYKGIPLVASVALVLSQQFNRSLPWTFNRKESKNYGEGGMLVGARVEGKNILLVDDVLTAGTAIRESLELIKQYKGRPIGVVVALDRMESVGTSGRTTLQQLRDEQNLLAEAVVNLDNLFEFIKDDPNLAIYSEKMAQYRKQYGVNSCS